MSDVDAWGGTLHLCDAPIQKWGVSLKEQLADMARLLTRSDMQCINRGFNVLGTMKAIQSFSWTDQCLLRQIMTGAITPADVLHKQHEKNSRKCPQSGALLESPWHR